MMTEETPACRKARRAAEKGNCATSTSLQEVAQKVGRAEDGEGEVKREETGTARRGGEGGWALETAPPERRHPQLWGRHPGGREEGGREEAGGRKEAGKGSSPH